MSADPKRWHTPGVDATTGPLGQGIAMAVGMAMAEAHLRARFNKPNFPVVDHYTYVFTSDGDLQEGVAMEALALAGHQQLERLIMLYDSNDTQLNGPTQNVSSTNIKALCEAFQIAYLLVCDANDTKAIKDAIEAAKQHTRPTLIEVKSKLAYGSSKVSQSSAHGAPLGTEEVERIRLKWAPGSSKFHVPNTVYDDFKRHLIVRAEGAYEAWLSLIEAYQKAYPDDAKALGAMLENAPMTIPQEANDWHKEKEEASRVSGGVALRILSEHDHRLMGGSADLSSSTRIQGADGLFQATHRLGRDIDFGVREHAMGAIVNGLTLHGMRGFSGGFFTFSDEVVQTKSDTSY